MSVLFEYREEFARVLLALDPYLKDLVVVGSWAHRFYSGHPLARPSGLVPLGTNDADLAAELGYRPPHGQALQRALLDAGFRQELSGSTQPPVSAYYLGEDHDGFHVEFLVPLLGSETGRDGSPVAPVAIGGVTAQTVRFVEILLREPWELQLSPGGMIPLPRPVKVRIVNPGAYLLQKVLTVNRRRSDKGPKDLLYIYDTLTLFGGKLDELRPQAVTALQALHPTTRATALHLCEAVPATESLVAGAVRIAQASGRAEPPSAAQVSAACRSGLRALFAGSGGQ